MRKTLNKTLLAAIVVAIMSFACAFMTFGYANTSKSASADDLIVPTTYDTAVKGEGFTLIDGASVKTIGAGIKFGTIVTKAFHESLTKNGETVEYFATAKAVGGKVERAKAFVAQPDFTSADTVELRTYLNFDSYSDNTDAETKTAYAAEFTTSSFAKVTDKDGVVTYVKAYSEKADFARSMMAVGNEAVLKGEESGAEYVGDAVRSTDITAYSLGNGKMAIKMPGLVNEEEKVNVYVGAEKHVASYDAVRNVYTIASGAPVNDNVSIFVGANNDVYSTKAAEATEITTEAQLATFRTTATVDGNYVLGNDITCATDLGAPSNTFTGILDGLGYTITANLKASVNNGLIKTLGDGAIVKNLNIICKGFTINSGAITYTTSNSANTTIENVVIDVPSLPSGCAPIASINQGQMTVKDSVLFVRSMSAQERGTAGSKFVWNNNWSGAANAGYRNDIKIDVDNVHIIYCSSGNNARVVTNSSADNRIFGEIKTYRYLNEFTSAREADKVDIPAEVGTAFDNEVMSSVIYVDASNFVETFQNTSSGYMILTEDVVLEEVWEDKVTKTAGKEKGFDGPFIFDGNNHKISNIEYNTTGYEGFIERTKTNAVQIINADLQFAAFNSRLQALVGQNRAPLTIYNSLLTYENISGGASGAIATMSDNDGYIILKDTVIHAIKTTQSDTNTGMLIGGSYGNVKEIALQDVAIIDDSGVINTLNGTDKQTPIVGDLNKDYYWIKGLDGLEALGDLAAEGKVNTNVVELLNASGKIVAVNQDNFGVLQDTISGYYYLTSDIDIDAYNTANETTYTAAQAQNNPFKGFFNGCGYTINNNTKNPVCVFSAVVGTFKNFTLKIANAFANNSGAFAFITKGASTFKNIVVDSAVKIGVYGCGPLLRSVQGEAKFSNIFVNAPEMKVDTRAGFLAGGQADSANIIVEKVYAVDPVSSGLKPLHSSQNGKKALGVGGAEASTDNKDYYVFTSLEKVADAMNATENALVIDDSLKALLEKSGVLVALNQENIEKLMTATGGYWYLTEDVDLTDIPWGGTPIFTGVLDGRNHKMANISLSKNLQNNALFKEIHNATIKNIYLDVVGVSGNYAGCIASVMRKTNNLTNVVVDSKNFVSYAGGTIAYYQEGDLNITNVLMMISGDTKKDQQAILTSNYGRDFNASNFYILNENAALTAMFGHSDTGRHGTIYKADGTTKAVENTDYYNVNAKENLPLSAIKATALANLLGEDFFS